MKDPNAILDGLPGQYFSTAIELSVLESVSFGSIPAETEAAINLLEAACWKELERPARWGARRKDLSRGPRDQARISVRLIDLLVFICRARGDAARFGEIQERVAWTLEGAETEVNGRKLSTIDIRRLSGRLTHWKDFGLVLHKDSWTTASGRLTIKREDLSI